MEGRASPQLCPPGVALLTDYKEYGYAGCCCTAKWRILSLTTALHDLNMHRNDTTI